MSELSNNNISDEIGPADADEITTVTLDDEFNRQKRYINACGFDDATLRRRDNELKELERLYPNMCPSLLELAWNFCEYTPKEEQDRIIAEKRFEAKPVKKREMGGTIKNAVSVESRN